ncbi:hypothetical protein H4R99_000663 [Coemansia sp. RSA 1722]|nr:hypothetical protein IWW45_000547 [Coemansia sp. RSA 485]KAJ2606110.1 hypothetical protein H4R99_000663 [Coemansia sp. RSA 1722]
MAVNVRVGVGCFVTYRYQDTTYFLLGERQGSHGSSTWGLPGGHLEMGESWPSCARREVAEESGLLLSDISYINATNDIFDPQKLHYVTIFMKGTAISQEAEEETMPPPPPVARLLEPDKCRMWAWVSWKEMVRGVAVLRDACADENILQGCFEDKGMDDDKVCLDLSELFLPLVNLIRVYGESGPPLD